MSLLFPDALLLAAIRPARLRQREPQRIQPGGGTELRQGREKWLGKKIMVLLPFDDDEITYQARDTIKVIKVIFCQL